MSRIFNPTLFSVLILALAASEADAKERHLEQLRVALMSRAARCTSCHVDAKASKLNDYGAALTKLSHDDSLADRMASLEHRPEHKSSQDIDNDGFKNWVEILAGKNPADAADRPSKKKARRVERVVACSTCHSATNLPGKQGLEANPHNPLGQLLAKTYKLPRNKPAAKGTEAVRLAAERTPILVRFEKIKKKRPPKSKATFWQKLRMLRDPNNPDDAPSAKALQRFKKRAAAQRSKRKRDPTRGLDCDAHEADGFLQDAKSLD